ncbi:hypothetical protein [Aliiglaciecola sp. LCG003]|uniref:hypothetical protein n=1 Tax=Aliiglaciecola sp. LCG003 TaxID=3053655 RepID=UPI0025746643|nr:hypothetical protein [Aliiglaciecola sp. LCG003]WJG08954.1 hypothetical protein QR722_16725 [Aliiglaciecola sp. LCG003]
MENDSYFNVVSKRIFINKIGKLGFGSIAIKLIITPVQLGALTIIGKQHIYHSYTLRNSMKEINDLQKLSI